MNIDSNDRTPTNLGCYIALQPERAVKFESFLKIPKFFIMASIFRNILFGKK